MRERVQEARKRLKRGKETPIEREPIQPLPLPSKDEREGVPPIDFQEVDELRRAFVQMQAQRHGEESVTGEAPPSHAPCLVPASRRRSMRCLSV